MPTGVFKRKPFTKEHRENMGKAQLGRKHSEETKKKLREARKRYFKTHIHPMQGESHSPEVKEKIRRAIKGNIPWNKGKKRPNVTGENHPMWKGGRRKTVKGYILIHNPNHPHHEKSGYVMEHRLVVEAQIGRYLTPEEKCHHLGEKDDNRPHMLMAFINTAAHNRFEHNCLVKLSEIIFDGRQL